MADVHKFSERVIDVAERTSAVADAAQGKKVRRGGMPARWFLLPAAGAGLYALMTNRSFTRQAKSVMNQAKERASDLPEVGGARPADHGPKSSSASSSPSTRKSASRTTQRRKTNRPLGGVGTGRQSSFVGASEL
jgi:hypothetical protein